MNYCTKCKSFYEKPGTCNCYAEQTAPVAPSPWVYPTYPLPPYPPTFYPVQPTSPTTVPFSPFKYETTCGTVGIGNNNDCTVRLTYRDNKLYDHNGGEVQSSWT